MYFSVYYVGEASVNEQFFEEDSRQFMELDDVQNELSTTQLSKNINFHFFSIHIIIFFLLFIGNMTLQKRLREIQQEAQIEQSLMDEVGLREQVINNERKWSRKRKLVEAGFSRKRDDFLEAYIMQQGISESVACSDCLQLLPMNAVRCNTCKEHFCGDCDRKFHSKRPFHDRELFGSTSSTCLLPNEFLDFSTGMTIAAQGINL